MAELKIEIPDRLEKEMERLPENWSEIAVEAIKLRVFESHLSRSKELQRAVLESLASKSKLTEKDALELGRKVNEGMLKQQDTIKVLNTDELHKELFKDSKL